MLHGGAGGGGGVTQGQGWGYQCRAFFNEGLSLMTLMPLTLTASPRSPPTAAHLTFQGLGTTTILCG